MLFSGIWIISSNYPHIKPRKNINPIFYGVSCPWFILFESCFRYNI